MSTDWHTDEFPELRPGPPWVMQEMIAAQPAVIEEILTDPSPAAGEAAAAIGRALEQRDPVTVSGCGTSEHAASGVAALIAAAVSPELGGLVRARPAMSAALDPAPGVLVAVSHDGGTRATTLALQAAAAAGAATIAITHQPDGPVALAADHVLVTPRHDVSWCHTLAYTSALAAGAVLAGHVSPLVADPPAARALVCQVTELAAAQSVARVLAPQRVLLMAGALSDHITARELALKVAEGARLPALPLELETVLHGTLAGHEPADALILVAITDHPQRDRIIHRWTHVARAAATIGMPVAALLSDPYHQRLPEDLTPAGRLIIQLPDPELVHPQLSGLLAGAGALQVLTLQLAHARQINPDLIRREQAPYREAAEQAEATADW